MYEMTLIPKKLKPSFIIEPMDTHCVTVIVLHGFSTSSRYMRANTIPALKKTFGKTLKQIKFVFLNAPDRKITCYDNTVSSSWHDYLTDYGGSENLPYIEEQINNRHLEQIRNQIHQVIYEEAALFDGDLGKIIMFGESQGCCVALDAALTMDETIGGIFASFGQVYNQTFVDMNTAIPTVSDLPIMAYHGAKDDCISASLALRSYAKLIDMGFHDIHIHVEPLLEHCHFHPTEMNCFAKFLKKQCDFT